MMNPKILIQFFFIGMMSDGVTMVNQKQQTNGTTLSENPSDVASFVTERALLGTGTVDSESEDKWTESHTNKPNDELGVTDKINTSSLNTTKDKPWESEVWKYGGLILIGVGIPCNILSIVVLCEKSMRSSPTALALLVLAITDSFNLLNTGLGWTLAIGFELDKPNFIDLGYWPCKIGIIMDFVMTDFSPWIVGVISIERCIAVKLPHKVNYLCTKRVIFGALCLSFLILLAWNLQLGLIVSYKEDDDHFTYCTWDTDFIQYKNTFWVCQDLLMLSFIPLSIVIICNTVIVKAVFKQHRERITMMKGNVMASQKKKINSMALMLIAVSAVLCICTVPFTVFNVWVESMEQTIENKEFAGKYNILFSWILYINYAVNFWLYVFAGSKFRRILFRLFSHKNYITTLDKHGPNIRNVSSTQEQSSISSSQGHHNVVSLQA